MPWYTKYDWVTVETYDPDTRSFNLHWRDDFDILDLDRWDACNGHRFSGNSATFFESQVFVADGALHIKLEPDEDAGMFVSEQQAERDFDRLFYDLY